MPVYRYTVRIKTTQHIPLTINFTEIFFSVIVSVPSFKYLFVFLTMDKKCVTTLIIPKT